MDEDQQSQWQDLVAQQKIMLDDFKTQQESLLQGCESLRKVIETSSKGQNMEVEQGEDDSKSVLGKE